MMKHIYILLIIFAGCKSNFKQKKQFNDDKNDQSSKLDSLKWLMYALNNYGKIQAKDSSSRKVELPVVSFNIKLSTEYQSNDTTAYGFEFEKKGYHSIWVDQPLPVMGISVYGANKYFLNFPHIQPDFSKSPDSIRWYIERADKSFRDYLQTYKGDIAPWLKDEIAKRHIMQ